MFKAVKSPYLVPEDGSFRVDKAPTRPPKKSNSKEENRARLEKLVAELDRLQRVLYADNRYAVLLVFQAMDAAGKDSTIRAVLSGVNPAGCQVFSFKQPTAEELEHDFLWRTHIRLPERGRIGVFNRSYYEEVLVVRVHPEYLDAQNLPDRPKLSRLWLQRHEAIRNHELHLARNGMIVLKFWLNVSREEQAKRFRARLEDPSKNWKFSPADLEERKYWDDYMNAYDEALNATSRSWAPWYAIPADDKSYTQVVVADIIVRSLETLPLAYPRIPEGREQEFASMRAELA